MQSTIEARVPYLTNELLQIADRTSTRYINQREPKIVVKEHLKRIYKQYNGQQRKLGFGGPLEKWIRSNEKYFCEKSLSCSRKYLEYEMTVDDFKLLSPISIFALAAIEVWMEGKNE